VKRAFGGISGASNFAYSDEGEISKRSAVRQAGVLTTLKSLPDWKKTALRRNSSEAAFYAAFLTL
jgi:hypothetical protein